MLVLDRSPEGVARTRAGCRADIEAGVLSTLCAHVEDFTLSDGVAPFDLAFACRAVADVCVRSGRTARHPRHHEGDGGAVSCRSDAHGSSRDA